MMTRSNKMKSGFLYFLGCSLTLLLTIPQNLNAQYYQGLQGGMNISTLMGGDPPFPNPDFKLGLNGGLVFGLEFSDKFALEADLGIITKGANQDYTEPLSDELEMRVESELNLIYGQGDLIAKFSTPIDRIGVIPYGPFTRRVFLDFFIGGYGSYFLSGNLNNQYSVFNADSLISDMSYDSTEAFKSNQELGLTSIDFGAVAGFGIKIKVGKEEKGRIFANFRYAFGMYSIDNLRWQRLEFNDKGDPIIVRSSLTNQSIIFSVGYAYSFKGGPNRIQ